MYKTKLYYSSIANNQHLSWITELVCLHMTKCMLTLLLCLDANHYNSTQPDSLHLPYMLPDSDINYHHQYPSTNNAIPLTETGTGMQCRSRNRVESRNGNDENLKDYQFMNEKNMNKPSSYDFKSSLKSWNNVHLASSITFLRR